MNTRAPAPAGAIMLRTNIIDGKAVPAADGRTLDCLCPSDGMPFAAIPRSGRRRSTPPWPLPVRLSRQVPGAG